MTQQARFESTLRRLRPNLSLRKYRDGQYMDSRVDFMWEMWQEAVKL